MAGALLLTKAEEKAHGRRRTEIITGLSVGALGMVGSFIGYVGMHNRTLELTGYGLVFIGTLLVGKPQKPAKVDLPDLANIEGHPLRLVERLDELTLEAAK